MSSYFAPLILFLALMIVPKPWSPAETSPEKPPVLVELFTSEGCSSCPPADALLRELQSTQPVPGARIIALGLHVDYWDYIGWKDRFSSPQFSRRQERYARRFNLGPYTPQLVVDGSDEVLGSDRRAAFRAIAKAAREPKPVSVRLTREHDRLHVLVEGSSDKPAEVLLAIVQGTAETKVVRGENGGKTLQHAAIARSLEVLGPLEQEKWEREVRMTLPADADPGNLEVVVFVQRRNGRVLGAATLSLAGF
jgi:hypothetical protein